MPSSLHRTVPRCRLVNLGNVCPMAGMVQRGGCSEAKGIKRTIQLRHACPSGGTWSNKAVEEDSSWDVVSMAALDFGKHTPNTSSRKAADWLEPLTVSQPSRCNLLLCDGKLAPPLVKALGPGANCTIEIGDRSDRV